MSVDDLVRIAQVQPHLDANLKKQLGELKVTRDAQKMRVYEDKLRQKETKL